MTSEVVPDEAPQRENPYVGLVPFGKDDVPWFFGRDREQRIIGANLRSRRLTLLYGASGVGKSSVLMAAVVPALRGVVAEDLALRERRAPGEREPVRFSVAVFAAWRDAPLQGLTAAIAASIEDATGETLQPWPLIPLADASLSATLAEWLRRHPVRTLLVVLDQFEEYFLYHPRAEGPGTFAGEFIDVVNDPNLRVNFLVSLREDGLAKLDRFKGHIPRLFDNYLRVGHLDLDAARRAIEGPKDLYNELLPDGADPAEIDPDLIGEVLKQVSTHHIALEGPDAPAVEMREEGDAATGRVETPLLQLVMQRLWAGAGQPPHLSLETLKQLGNTRKIVYRHLVEALGDLNDAERDLAVDVLRPLVSPTGTKIARSAADLAHFAKRSGDDVDPILSKLSDGKRRILRTDTPSKSEADQTLRYEIFHDVLAQPILKWCTEREVALRLKREEQERLEAERQRRRERRNRAVRGVAIVLAALTAGLVVAVLVAYSKNEIADSRGLASSAMAQLPIDPERGVLLAEKAVQRRGTSEAQQALRRALAASRVRARRGPDGLSRPCGACGALASAPASGGDGAATRHLAIAPDGRAVAAIVGSQLALWSPQNGKTLPPGVRVGDVSGVAFTPDARRLLVVGGNGAAAMSPDGTHAVALRGAHTSGATSPDSRSVATVGSYGARVWDARSGRLLAELPSPGDAFGRYQRVAFRNAGELVLQTESGAVVSWPWLDGDPTLRAKPDGDGSVEMSYSGGGAVAVEGAADGKVRVVAARGEPVRLPAGSPDEPVDRVAISPDGTRILTVREAVAELWSSKGPWSAKAPRVADLVHTDSVADAVFSADSRLIGTASLDGTARVWESSTGELVAELRGHAAGVQAMGFSTSGRFVATVGEDLTIRLWDLGEERALRGPLGVTAVAPATSGSRVAIVEDTGAVKVWDTHSRSARRLPDDGTMQPSSIALGPGDRALVGYETADRTNGRAALLDLRTGRPRATIDGGPVHRVALDPSGRVAAIVNDAEGGGGVRLWDLARAGAAVPLAAWRASPISDAELAEDVAFSPDGRRVLVTTVFGAARVFDVRTRKEVLKLERAAGSRGKPGEEAFYHGVFSPDGSTIAVAGSRDVRLWDSRTGEERPFRLSGHTSVVRSVAYSADGKRIVTASADGTTRVWDAKSGTTLTVLSRHAGRVNSAAFMPDGSIVSGGEDRTVRVYPCETCEPADRLLDDVRKQVTRGLTKREIKEFVG